MVRKANIIQKQELGGGKGCAEVHEIVPEKDLYGHGKLYAKVVLNRIPVLAGIVMHLYLLSPKTPFTYLFYQKTEPPKRTLPYICDSIAAG